MEPCLHDNVKQASQATPTIEEVNNWDAEELLEWIKRHRPKLLNGVKVEEFEAKIISGDVFLHHAGDVEFFEKKCNLPIGASERFAYLASEVIGKQNMSPKTKKRKNPPHADTAPSPKRTRVGDSSLVINGKLKHFRSGSMGFSQLLQEEGQAYFDRTRYIFMLHELDKSILFCRPRRFGKSLTVSMMEHFHGLQYASEHKSLYKGLDVQKDIDEGKASPGQYFVLKFDFSKINPSPDLTEAHKTLVKFLNTSLESFYKTYATYLGESCGNIDSEQPNLSLRRCAESVRYAIKHDERLDGIKGIYVLVDEYDAFANNYLDPPNIVGAPKAKVAWEDTAVGRTFRSFWATIKSLCTKGFIQRTFITGISPLSLSSLGSAFNVARNLSFHGDLAGLCGLTYADLDDALEGIDEGAEPNIGFLSEMSKFFNGYHFCKDEIVETVYNTETCLAYLQCRIERVVPETEDLEDSEVSEQFLRRFATSAPLIRDFEKALERDDKGVFVPLKYGRFKSEFTLRDLNQVGDRSSWRSLIVYFGGLTFHPEKPTTHLKILNSIAANRIALAVFEPRNACGHTKWITHSQLHTVNKD